MINQRSRKSKSLTKPILMLLVLGSLAAVIFWYFFPSSRPDWLADKLPVAASATTTVYKWKGNDGLTVISDQQPPEGVEFEMVEYRNDQNVIPSNDEN